jgi:hypothetical protein
VFCIGITFSEINPIFIPFCVLYFFSGYYTFKYEVMYIYTNTYESGGGFFNTVRPP